jgi:hypothetical protein
VEVDVSNHGALESADIGLNGLDLDLRCSGWSLHIYYILGRNKIGHNRMRYTFENEKDGWEGRGIGFRTLPGMNQSISGDWCLLHPSGSSSCG